MRTIFKLTVFLGVVFATSCSGTYGYRVGLGPQVFSDGSVGGAVRVGVHFGFSGDPTESDNTGIGLTPLVIESEFTGKSEKMGVGIGLEYTRYGALQTRIGLRGIAGGSDYPIQFIAAISPFGWTESKKTWSQRSATNVFGAEFRFLVPTEEERPFGYYLGFNWERHHTWAVDFDLWLP